MPPVQGYGLGRREGNGSYAPAAAPSRPTPPIPSEAPAQPAGAVGEGAALSGTGSSGSGPVIPGEGGVGPVKHKAAGEPGGAGRVSVPPRATTSDEVRQCPCISVAYWGTFCSHTVVMRLYTYGSVARITC